MENLLQKLPTIVIVLGVLFFGIILVFIFMPPKNICDAQIVIFEKQQSRFLIEEITKVKQALQEDKISPGYQNLIKKCQGNPTLGGCYTFFYYMKSFLKDLEAFPRECQKSIAKVKNFSKVIWKSLELIIKVAWGDKPEREREKVGWLKPSELYLFCKIKQVALDVYGEGQWKSFSEKLLKEFSEKSSDESSDETPLSLVDTRKLSLFSLNCREYL